MKLNHFTNVLKSLSKLTNNQIHILQHRINDEINKGGTNLLIDECKGGDIVCPHCGSETVGKWGSSCGLQRYRCKAESCRKTFNALTKTPLARLRKRHLWQANLDCMFDTLPLWRVAEELEIAISTAFRWRHRFLKAPTQDKPSELAGIIEADEMIFMESYKGNQTIHDRKPRKRGGLGDRRCKDDKIPVLIAKDRNGGLTDCILEEHTNKAIHDVLKPIVNTESILCTDGAHAYRAFAKEENIEHVRIIASKGERVKKKTYHIQNVNNHMSQTRTWMAPFHGVGTAYLANYLGWMRMRVQNRNDKSFSLKMLFDSNFRNVALE